MTNIPVSVRASSTSIARRVIRCRQTLKHQHTRLLQMRHGHSPDPAKCLLGTAAHVTTTPAFDTRLPQISLTTPVQICSLCTRSRCPSGGHQPPKTFRTTSALSITASPSGQLLELVHTLSSGCGWVSGSPLVLRIKGVRIFRRLRDPRHSSPGAKDV